MVSHGQKQNEVELTEQLFNNFKVPTWAGKPQLGLHLDVLKEGKLIQKMMIDEKKCYFFGRNRQLCDFPIDHESCSRVHAALVWHRFVNRPFVIDLGSTHGTFIGKTRLEPHKPQQVPINSIIHFGASSRVHIIREKPQTRNQQPQSLIQHLDTNDKEGNYLGLPQSESELDNLTEFNTAQNRRIAVVADVHAAPQVKPQRKNCITFAEEDDIINPEDVDPTVGRFRNLVYETFIPNKRSRLEDFDGTDSRQTDRGYHAAAHLPDTGQDSDMSSSALTLGTFSAAAKLGLPLPNLAPDVEATPPAPVLILSPSVTASTGPARSTLVSHASNVAGSTDTPRKKKYAKEAWPGKRPGFLVAPS